MNNVDDVDYVWTYEEICGEMREILREEKELSNRKEEVRKKLIEMAGGDRMEHGILVVKRERDGTIDYRSLVDDMKIDSMIMEGYRGKKKEYYEVRAY